MPNNSYKDVLLPVYVVNLERRIDRLQHIYKQFENKPEFELHIVAAVEDNIGAVGLWKSLLKCIRTAKENDEDLIIFCEDDHAFTGAYTPEFLISNIIEANEQECDILIGGIGNFSHAVPITSHRYWVSSFWSTQFLVIYKDIFEAILNTPFDKHITADGKLSELTMNKMVLYPFISVQHDFGYSDVETLQNERRDSLADLFRKSAERLEAYKNVYENYVRR